MKGWQIFTHSVRQVMGNLNAAIRVSGVLYIIQFILSLSIGATMMQDEAAMEAAVMAGEFPWVSMLLIFVITMLTSVWIAVGWHRYVLRIEEPGFLPPFLGDRILGYFGKSLLIGLMLAPLLLLLGLLAGFLLLPVAQSGNAAVALLMTGLIVYLPVGVVGLRLSTILPGVALEPGRSVLEGWTATAGETGSFVILVLASLLMVAILNAPTALVFGAGSVVALIWQFIVGWFVTMVSVSILTTLYGHYIEKRPLL